MSEPRTPKRRRAIGRLLLFALVTSGLAWLAVWGAIHGWYPELQRRAALALLNDGGAYAIEIDRLGGSLVDGFEVEGVTLRAHEPVLADPNIPGTGAVPLRVASMSFAVDVPALYEERRVHIPVLEIEGVVFEWMEAQDRETPAPPAPEPTAAEETEPWTIAIDDLRLRDARLRASLAPERGAAPLEVEGTAHLSGFAWSTDGEPPRFEDFAADLRLIDARVGPVDIVSGRARVVGTREAIELRVERVQAGVENRGRLHLVGQAHAHFTEAAVSLDTLVVDDVALDLSFIGLDLAPLSFFAGPEGLSFPETRLRGAARLSKPDLWQVDFQLDPSEVEGFAFSSGRARARVDLARELWELDDAIFEAGSARLALEAHGAAEGFEELSVDATDFPLDTLQRLARPDTDDPSPEAVRGSVDVAARLSGTGPRPTGRVDAEGVALVGERPALSFAAAVELEADGAARVEAFEVASLEGDSEIRTLEPSRWRVEDGLVSAENLVLETRQNGASAGRVTLRRLTTDGERHTLEADFDDFAIAPPFELFGEVAPIDGRLSGPLELDMRRRQPRLVADLEVTAPTLEDFTFERLELVADTENELWKWNSRLAWNGIEPLSLSVVMPGEVGDRTVTQRLADPRTHIALSLADLDVRQLTPFLPGEWLGEDALEGTVAGALSLVGTQEGPVVTGDVSWTRARLGTARADHVALRAETEAGQLALDFDITHQGQSAFDAEAELELARLLEEPTGWLRDPRNRSVMTAEDVDLAWLVPRASARRLGRVEAVEGRATGRVELRGSPDGPVIDGRLDVDRAQLELALFDEPIGPITAALRFDNRALHVDRVVIGSTKGDAVVKGRYRFASANRKDRVDLDMRFAKFSLTHFPLLEARVTGDLELTGPLAALDAKGDLSFRRVHVSLPAAQDPLLREVRILGLEEPEGEDGSNGRAAEPSAYQTMQAQIAIDVRRGAKIRERGADLEVEGQILLRKRRLSPTLLQGSLATTGGTYTFFGRKFEVREGIANFEERLPPDPDLRIEATRHVGDVTVGVRRVGRWSEPAAELFSEPEMGETDILSYLMFNKPRSELGAADDAQLNSATAQVASNLALAELTRALSTELPINEISMEVGEDMTVSSVGVETNVGEDIILRYDRALQDGVGDRFTVEWRFWKNLSLRSEYAEGGTSGLDLFWSYEY